VVASCRAASVNIGAGVRKFALAAIVCASASGFISPAGAEQGTSPKACWAEGALSGQPGEDRIEKNVPQAFIPPPKSRPIEFTPIPHELRGSIRRVKLPAGMKLIAITFDLCEQPYEVAGYQGDIVDYLRREGIKATFFAGGKWMLTHRLRTQQLMSDPLFELGNHTWEHRNLRLLSGPALHSEIEGAQLAYEQVRRQLEAKQCFGRDNSTLAHERAPKSLNLFRFPFGACDTRSLEAVAESGLLAVQWDISSGDPWSGQSAQRMARAVISGVHPGSIVLFHANGRGWHTGRALPIIVGELRAQGYQFVTVSELLSVGAPVRTPICYDSKPGDTDHYDQWGRRLKIIFRRAKPNF